MINEFLTGDKDRMKNGDDGDDVKLDRLLSCQICCDGRPEREHSRVICDGLVLLPYSSAGRLKAGRPTGVSSSGGSSSGGDTLSTVVYH